MIWYFQNSKNSFKMIFRQRVRWQRGNLIIFFKKWGYLFKSFLKKPTWSKYDELVSLFPKELISITSSFLYQILSLIFFLTMGGTSYTWQSFYTYLFTFFVGGYFSYLFLGAVYYISDIRKLHITFPKALLNLLLFPFYDMFAFVFIYCGIFSSGKWKHIDHFDAIPVSRIEKEKQAIEARLKAKGKKIN